MKILWHSNSPTTQSGYGVQTNLFTDMMAKEGWEAIVSAFYGHRGFVYTQANGVRVLPGSLSEYGNDILVGHVEHFKPDLTIALIDVWVLENPVLEKAGIVSWCPVDHMPIPPLVEQKLRHARRAWSMSPFGQRMMRANGIDNDYVPHGVDVEAFKPMEDRSAARGLLKNVDDDTFIVAVVAANKGLPSRKNLDQILQAWARFAVKHPNSLLIMHTLKEPAYNGLDLEAYARVIGVPQRNLQFSDTYGQIMGFYTDAIMNKMYNAADVMLLPSAGGGFEIPLIEAQAAGCPVITTKFTAMTDLIGAGWGIEVDEDDLMVTTQYAFQALRLPPSKIEAQLEAAYEARGDMAIRRQAREFALNFDHRKVWQQYMKPAIVRLVEEEKEREARTIQRRALRAPEVPTCDHEWHEIGVKVDGVLHIPCTKPGCNAALKRLPEGHDMVVENYFGSAVEAPIDDDDTQEIKPVVEGVHHAEPAAD